jgi:hypothetical protein
MVNHRPAGCSIPKPRGREVFRARPRVPGRLSQPRRKPAGVKAPFLEDGPARHLGPGFIRPYPEQAPRTRPRKAGEIWGPYIAREAYLGLTNIANWI